MTDFSLTRRGVLAALSAPLAGKQPAPGSGSGLETGFDALSRSGYAALRGQRVGLIANQTSVDRNLRHIVDVMHDDPRVTLGAIFSPEHGFRGSAQAGTTEAATRDPRTGLPVTPLYGLAGPALEAALARSGVDVILFDIQDIGTRFYTYVWTLFDVMAAAARLGWRVMVLDRPNPISGAAPRGPVLDPRFASFLGRAPIALQHGMTVGKLARMFNDAPWAGSMGSTHRPVQLDISPMRGWSRGLFQDETGLPWVPTSPNMPSLETAMLYPGTGLFEGTTLSVGRGTTSPFQLLGGVGLDSGKWVEALSRLRLPGVLFREAAFVPGFSVFSGKVVQGVQVVMTDRSVFDAPLTGIAMMVTALAIWPDFGWTNGGRMIDLLSGSDALRLAVERGVPADEIVHGWQSHLSRFSEIRSRYLLY